MTRGTSFAFTAAMAVVAATPALAHTGVGHAAGFAAGLAHPVFGADHLLAMLSVGVWSALAVPNRMWLTPLAFVTAMLAGAALAFAGVALPAVEGMIAASVLAFGLMIAIGARLTPAAGVALVGLFAAFHGHAHASEATGGVLAYVAGFALATAAIHLAGISIGTVLIRRGPARLALGAAVTMAGAAMMAGL